LADTVALSQALGGGWWNRSEARERIVLMLVFARAGRLKVNTRVEAIEGACQK
jgi:hypothetical protein